MIFTVLDHAIVAAHIKALTRGEDVEVIECWVVGQAPPKFPAQYVALGRTEGLHSSTQLALGATIRTTTPELAGIWLRKRMRNERRNKTMREKRERRKKRKKQR